MKVGEKEKKARSSKDKLMKVKVKKEAVCKSIK